ncbi:superoxide dismutase [Cu-Zn] [Callorhinchus milii]|uniref:superoxide dismutase n=2 Tax=Callorhinchus milii TaxID=7868 RepID=V9LFV9_CALMI|nr:superoxide dismutase [Cu-Zn] [Callorhinchus milii]|eukprot:gi/632971608/ref/XP_007902254.1/ PREDICTED: superoxide dismutase [Cu-Zn]-like [Callorhinchus milii]
MVVKAVCVLKDESHFQRQFPPGAGDTTPGVAGVVQFEWQENEPVLIKGNISGLAPGKHGLHVCTFGNLLNGHFSLGSHFNPYEKKHGGPEDEERHVGDLGNVIANKEGVAEFQIQDRLLQLSGVLSIIGRSLVIEEKEDDLGKAGNEESLLTGNSGKGLACGVIGIADVVMNLT